MTETTPGTEQPDEPASTGPAPDDNQLRCSCGRHWHAPPGLSPVTDPKFIAHTVIHTTEDTPAWRQRHRIRARARWRRLTTRRRRARGPGAAP